MKCVSVFEAKGYLLADDFSLVEMHRDGAKIHDLSALLSELDGREITIVVRHEFDAFVEKDT